MNVYRSPRGKTILPVPWDCPKANKKLRLMTELKERAKLLQSTGLFR